MAHTFKLACVVVLTCHVIITHQEGTPRNLQETFKDRCGKYRSYLAPAPNVSCDDLWVQFSSAWIYKDPNGGQAITYNQLIRHVAQKLPRDQLLFWSGTKILAHRLSKRGIRYVTLEDTLIGSVADGLTWCGRTSGDGINYIDCPSYESNAAVKNFWFEASRWFASQAAGNVSVLLNGSDPSKLAYRRDSIFGSVEVPNLQSRVVTKLTAIVAHDLGKRKIEDCRSQSLLALKSDVLKRRITFDCCVYPKEEMKKGNSPYNPECAQLNDAVILGHFKHGRSLWARLTSATTMSTLLMISFMYM